MIQNKTATVKELIRKDGGKFTLKTQEGDGFAFFQFKKDGSLTQQYQHVVEEPNAAYPGMVVKIGYEDASFTNTDGKLVTYKKLVSMYPYDGSVDSAKNVAPRAAQSLTGASYGPSQSDTHTSIIRQVAFKGAVELISAGKLTIPEGSTVDKVLQTNTNTFQGIIENKVEKPLVKPASVGLPVIDESVPAGTDLEEIDAADIPF